MSTAQVTNIAKGTIFNSNFSKIEKKTTNKNVQEKSNLQLQLVIEKQVKMF